jgi:hypothetical protein
LIRFETIPNPGSQVRVNRVRWLAILLWIVVLSCCQFSNLLASDDISINGYYKNYFTALDRGEMENLPSTQYHPLIGAVYNRLRTKVFIWINHRASLTFAYDFSPRVQDHSLFEEQILDLGFTPQSYRVTDLDARLYPDPDDTVRNFAIFQNLDRICLTINTRWADIYLGRQAIAWGSARVINPTDVIVPFAFNELDVEDRIGVDAVRIRVPIGTMEEIDAGWAFGDDFEFENSAMFLRTRLYYRRTDITLLAVGFRENLLTGLNLAGSFGGAGFWLEGAYVFVDALNSDRSGNQGDYFRSSAGLDYILRDGTYLFAEYHFNQAGANDADDYLSRFKETAYSEGAVYLLGRHYLSPGASCQITPLVTVTGEAIINLTDQSSFLTPQIEYNIAEDIYLSGGAYLGFGKGIGVSSLDYFPYPRPYLQSEFGAYPDMYFASFRIYF